MLSHPADGLQIRRAPARVLGRQALSDRSASPGWQAGSPRSRGPRCPARRCPLPASRTRCSHPPRPGPVVAETLHALDRHLGHELGIWQYSSYTCPAIRTSNSSLRANTGMRVGLSDRTALVTWSTTLMGTTPWAAPDLSDGAFYGSRRSRNSRRPLMSLQRRGRLVRRLASAFYGLTFPHLNKGRADMTEDPSVSSSAPATSTARASRRPSSTSRSGLGLPCRAFSVAWGSIWSRGPVSLGARSPRGTGHPSRTGPRLPSPSTTWCGPSGSSPSKLSTAPRGAPLPPLGGSHRYWHVHDLDVSEADEALPEIRPGRALIEEIRTTA